MGISVDMSGIGGMDGYIKMMKQEQATKLNHKSVKLKNPIKPYTGPDVKVTIPYARYPHIIDTIVKYSEPKALLNLRATCRAITKRVDREYAHHIEVVSDGNNIRIWSRHLGAIPSIRFKGVLTIGASYVPPGVRLTTPRDQERVMQQTVERIPPPHCRWVWLRVAPESIPWFKTFMKDCHTVDMDGANTVTVLPASRDDQVGMDPFGRDFMDSFPVSVLRLYPDSDGGYSHFKPFTARYHCHSIELIDPAKPAQKTWLYTSPLIPEGTEQLLLGVHLHPDLPPLGAGAAVTYPTSLKRLAINLEPFPIDGQKRATLESFKALGHFWIKVFTNFRPGMQFFIYNIHEWDDVQHQLPMPTRDYLIMLFGTLWLGLKAAALGSDKLADLCSPHLKFLRGPFVFTEDPLDGYLLNPEGTPMTDVNGERISAPISERIVRGKGQGGKARE